MPDTPYPSTLAGDTSPSTTPSQPTREGQSPDLVKRVTGGAHQAVNQLAEKAGPAMRKLESGASQVNEALQEKVHHMREKGDEWTDNLRSTVRANPLTAILVAMAAGALLSRISRDR